MPATGVTTYAGPILPGKEEEWRRFVQDLEGQRLGEYERMSRRLLIRSAKVWVVRAARGEIAVATLEVEEPEGFAGRFALSGEPFDLWLKSRLLELHGNEVARVLARSVPKLVFAAPSPTSSAADLVRRRPDPGGRVADPRGK